MRSRHSVDTSVTFDRNAEQPPRRDIEVIDPERVPTERFDVDVVTCEPYRVSPELEDAVNLALALGRPLLLQGDPGAGKTRLAHAVAYALGWPLEQAIIKSTSQGRDLLYTFDAVRRLYDAQLRRDGDEVPVREYVTLGPLGRAIVRA
jgi:MoxR-like ATPase